MRTHSQLCPPQRFALLGTSCCMVICSFDQAQFLKQPASQCPFPGIYSAFGFFLVHLQHSSADFLTPAPLQCQVLILVPNCQSRTRGPLHPAQLPLLQSTSPSLRSAALFKRHRKQYFHIENPHTSVIASTFEDLLSL